MVQFFHIKVTKKIGKKELDFEQGRAGGHPFSIVFGAVFRQPFFITHLASLWSALAGASYYCFRALEKIN